MSRCSGRETNATKNLDLTVAGKTGLVTRGLDLLVDRVLHTIHVLVRFAEPVRATCVPATGTVLGILERKFPSPISTFYPILHHHREHCHLWRC